MRTLILVLGIFFISIPLLNGQKRISRITFKDSTVVNGFAKFLNEGKEVEFYSEKGSDPILYSYWNIEKVEMMTRTKPTTFTYIQVINQGTVKLAKLLVSGKLNLYRFSFAAEGWSPTAPNGFSERLVISKPQGPVGITTLVGAGGLRLCFLKKHT